MRDLLEVIVRHLVNDPHAVEMKETKGRNVSVYELHMPRADAARVIGKHGRTIESIRTIMNAAGSKSRQRVVLQVVDHPPGRKNSQSGLVPTTAITDKTTKACVAIR